MPTPSTEPLIFQTLAKALLPDAPPLSATETARARADLAEVRRQAEASIDRASARLEKADALSSALIRKSTGGYRSSRELAQGNRANIAEISTSIGREIEQGASRFAHLNSARVSAEDRLAVQRVCRNYLDSLAAAGIPSDDNEYAFYIDAPDASEARLKAAAILAAGAKNRGEAPPAPLAADQAGSREIDNTVKNPKATAAKILRVVRDLRS